jgi:hypothetical protein
MQEAPLSTILDPVQTESHVSEHLSDQIALLQDLANYGSNLVIRAYNSSSRDLPALITCGVLLKQVVAMLDAIHVLAKAGCVHAAHLPARAAFEASIYLDWILLSDGQRKATCYLVQNYRDERLWALRTTKGTPEEAAFQSIAREIGDIHARRPTLASDSQKNLAEVNRVLAQPALAAVDQEFNKLRGKRKVDPQWYELCGATSIRQVAVAVGRLTEYEAFYSAGSRITHTGAYRDHIEFGKGGEVRFVPIRYLERVMA